MFLLFSNVEKKMETNATYCLWQNHGLDFNFIKLSQLFDYNKLITLFKEASLIVSKMNLTKEREPVSED